MARIAEPEKIENIKYAVMEALVEHGYSGMSIATISQRAGVSPGYLYRFYESKEELVEELVGKEMERIVNDFIFDIDSSSTLHEAAYKTVKRLFQKANENPMAARFASSVVMDVKIPAWEKADNFKMIFDLADKCIKLGHSTGELHSKIAPVEVLIVSFTIPFRYLSFMLEMDKNKQFTEEEIKRITEICINALK